MSDPTRARSRTTLTGVPADRLPRLLVAVVVCWVALAGCASSQDAEARDAKVVAQALAEANSAAQAALLAVQTPGTDITSPYRRQVVADAEEGFDSAVSTFDGRQPPNTESSNALDARSAALLDRTGGDLRAVRIAVERGDPNEITNARRALEASAASLASASQELASS